jgi:hypothetical protein
MTEDALELQSNDTRVSPVVSVNGVDIVEYIASIGRGSQDWDAMYVCPLGCHHLILTNCPFSGTTKHSCLSQQV